MVRESSERGKGMGLERKKRYRICAFGGDGIDGLCFCHSLGAISAHFAMLDNNSVHMHMLPH